MRSAALAACLVLAACATTGTHVGSILPPARYDYPNEHMQVWQVSQAEITRLCEAPVIACARRSDIDPRPCVIIIPTSAPIGGAIYRHERAHCNGWPAHHPRN